MYGRAVRYGRRAATGGSSGEGLVELVRDPVGQDRAECAHAYGTAHAAEEGQAGGRGAEIVCLDVVLRGQHQVLHQHADADAEDGHVERQDHDVGLGVDGRQQQHARDHDGRTRREVVDALKARGVGSQVHYIPVHRQPYYRELYGDLHLPGAEAWYARCLSLPLYPGMDDADVAKVVGALKDALG